jgi:peroxiredoxin family protein
MPERADPAPVPLEAAPSVSELLARLDRLEAQIEARVDERVAERLREVLPEDRLALLVFSGTLDRILSALLLASTAASTGTQVDMFFTFWGLAALRDARKRTEKDALGRVFDMLLPRGLDKLPLSQLNLGGMGARLVRDIMKQKRFASAEEMLELCSELGVRIFACDMSGQVIGIQSEELIDYPHLEVCGAASFLEKAFRSRMTMFI